jgi:hypothetical protein
MITRFSHSLYGDYTCSFSVQCDEFPPNPGEFLEMYVCIDAFLQPPYRNLIHQYQRIDQPEANSLFKLPQIARSQTSLTMVASSQPGVMERITQITIQSLTWVESRVFLDLDAYRRPTVRHPFDSMHLTNPAQFTPRTKPWLQERHGQSHTRYIYCCARRSVLNPTSE